MIKRSEVGRVNRECALELGARGGGLTPAGERNTQRAMRGGVVWAALENRAQVSFRFCEAGEFQLETGEIELRIATFRGQMDGLLEGLLSLPEVS